MTAWARIITAFLVGLEATSLPMLAFISVAVRGGLGPDGGAVSDLKAASYAAVLLTLFPVYLAAPFGFAFLLLNKSRPGRGARPPRPLRCSRHSSPCRLLGIFGANDG